jgi:hypothetical protein
MLARETIRAIEEGCSAGAGAGAGTGADANGSQRNLDNKRGSPVTVEAMDDLTKPSISEHRMCNIFLPIGNRMDTELAAVEASKLEISSLEHQYSEIVALLRDVEGECRAIRKANEQLIREQKAAKDRIVTIDATEAEASQQNEAKVAELEQQIRDLSFYTRSKLQLAISPLRDEVVGGSVSIAVRSDSECPSVEAPRPKTTGTKKGTTR